jgi:hypothetical protein
MCKLSGMNKPDETAGGKIMGCMLVSVLKTILIYGEIRKLKKYSM